MDAGRRWFAADWPRNIRRAGISDEGCAILGRNRCERTDTSYDSASNGEYHQVITFIVLQEYVAGQSHQKNKISLRPNKRFFPVSLVPEVVVPFAVLP